MTDFAAARKAMVDCQIRPADVTRFPIIEAMLQVPRELFLPRELRDVAYSGEHVALGQGRVLLDPRILAKMLDALDVQPDEMVLDIGCGLGYSTAVIGWIAEAVVGVEADAETAALAEVTLGEQSADNTVVHTGSLAEGATEHGPYDVIIIEGGVVVLPQAIADQLKEGGRIAAIFIDGNLGSCHLGLKTGGAIAWRRMFDAMAPVLPGYDKKSEFVF